MASAINSVPILQGKEAVRFQKKEKEARAARASVDFKAQVEITRAILKKAKI